MALLSILRLSRLLDLGEACAACALGDFSSLLRRCGSEHRTFLTFARHDLQQDVHQRHSGVNRSSRKIHLTVALYFCNYRNMVGKSNVEQVAKYADMLSAMGTEARLRIMQLLLSAHPKGLVVGEILEELDIPNSTLSHHLDKLRTEGLVEVRRESTFLHYTANTEALRELLQFLYAECCTRNKALKAQDIVQIR